MHMQTFGPGSAYKFLLEISGEQEDDMYDYEPDDEYESPSSDTGSRHTWSDVAEKFTRAWLHASAKASTKKTKAAAKISPEQALVQLTEGSGYAAGVADAVSDAASDAVARGLVPEATEGALLWFNGILHFHNPLEALLPALQQEMQRVQVMWFTQRRHRQLNHTESHNPKCWPFTCALRGNSCYMLLYFDDFAICPGHSNILIIGSVHYVPSTTPYSYVPFSVLN